MADFAYFAFILGVAVQTADVAITSPHIRRVVTVHCIADSSSISASWL